MKVEIERVFNASPEKMYGMWTKPEFISTWMGVKVDINPILGGALTIDFGESVLTTGVFKELTPFQTVAFTWNSADSLGEPTGETLVTITLTEEGSGKTKMKLLHSGFKAEKTRSDHDQGWNEYFVSWEKKLGQ